MEFTVCIIVVIFIDPFPVLSVVIVVVVVAVVAAVVVVVVEMGCTVVGEFCSTMS